MHSCILGDSVAVADEQDGLVGKLVSMYERSPVLRMVVAAYPPLSVTESGLLATYKWWKARRMYVFADELVSLNLNPPEEQVKSREFCEAFGATASRVLETKREEKIRLFAHLLAAYVKGEDTTPKAFDDFEAQLNILDDLEYREFELLLLLRDFETKYPLQTDENQCQRTGRYWKALQERVQTQFDLSEEEMDAVLQRLIRTGLYHLITGNYWDYTGNRGHT